MFDLLLRQFLILIQPLGLIWLGLIILSVGLFRSSRRGWGTFAAILAAIITLVGSTDFPGWLLRSFERPWAGVKLADLPECDAVVVLGGGAEPSRYEAGFVHFTKAGDRVVMGMDLVRRGKARTLAIGGNSVDFEGERKVEADLVKGLLESWKFPDAEVISLGENSNTRDEGVKVAALSKERGWKRVLLVTSANHMTRAAAVFRTLGVEVVPVPCNFLTSVSTAPVPFRISLPRWDGMEKISICVHETVGWWIYRWRGWVK